MWGHGEANRLTRTRLTAGRAIVKWLIVGLSLPRRRLILSLICILFEVDIAAGLSGIESRRGRDFPPVQTGLVAHPASCKMGTGSFPGGKVRPGRAADHSPPYSAAVMEE